MYKSIPTHARSISLIETEPLGGTSFYFLQLFLVLIYRNELFKERVRGSQTLLNLSCLRLHYIWMVGHNS